jgi:hypothetical protein
MIGLLIVLLLAPAVARGASDPGPSAPWSPAPRIVNGVPTHGDPSVGVLLIDAPSGVAAYCTATLIGCRTVLTAAHCFCSPSLDLDDAATCQASPFPDQLRALSLFLLQHAGPSAITSLTIHPDYQRDEGGDLALLTLAQPVTGVPPAPLTPVDEPPPGTAARIVGFGRTGGDPELNRDWGLKRAGAVRLAPCTANIPADTHVCWSFREPLGAPGENSSTCEADSGGPLLLSHAGASVLAGVTSGGQTTTCLPEDTPYDTDIAVYRDWIIAEAGRDLGPAPCGTVSAVGSDGVTVAAFSGQLSPQQPRADHRVEVPVGTSALRIVLNGEEYGASSNDFDLFAKAGAPPGIRDSDCADRSAGPYGYCLVDSPAPGTWYASVFRFQGAGAYQLTVSAFGASCPGDCNADHAVAVDELVLGTSVAFGTAGIAACAALDRDASRTATIDELVGAVRAARLGCPDR